MLEHYGDHSTKEQDLQVLITALFGLNAAFGIRVVAQ